MLNISYSKGTTRWKLALLDHEELVQRLTDAAARAGWALTYQQQIDGHISRLTFSREGGHENVLAYLWNLRSRSNGHNNLDFYAESNNGVPLRQLEGVKTILLGYDHLTERFVGWDASRNSRAPIAATPSLTVSGECFSQAYPDGLAFYTRSETEVAVVFQSYALMNYVRNLEGFHGAVSEPEQNVLRRMSQAEGKIEDFATDSLPLERQVVVKAVARDWSKTSFRRRVLAAYQYRCAMCSGQSDVRAEVRAVHIVPVKHSESNDETSNGLCLCALHHRAFDQGLIAVLPDYLIAINRTKLALLQSQSLNAGEDSFIGSLQVKIYAPSEPAQRPNASLIRTALRVREIQHDSLEPTPRRVDG